MPDKTQAALQSDVRSGGNRSAYISRYKSFSGLANGQQSARSSERSCKYFPSRKQIAFVVRGLRASSAVSAEKITKIIATIYQESRVPTLLQQAPKKFKHSAPQKKTCLPGEGLDREKDPRSRPGSDCLVGCIWIVNCNGRRQPAPLLQASSGLFDQIGTLAD